TLILPALIFISLFLLPFIDRKPERNPWKRPIASSMATIVMIALISLISLSHRDDQRDPLVKAQLDRQTQEAERSLAAPFVPQPMGKRAMPLAPATPAPAIYLAKCAACHGDAGQGMIGPNLHNLANKPRRAHDDIVKITR